MLRVGVKGIHALLWEMVFRQERHQLPLRHLFGYQPKLISAVALSAENRGALAIAKSTSVW